MEQRERGRRKEGTVSKDELRDRTKASERGTRNAERGTRKGTGLRIAD